MIAKEIRYRFSHYGILLAILSVLFALFLFAQLPTARIVLAIGIAASYILWGIWSHRNEVRTLRLVLEYIAIGVLGAVMLIVLTQAL